jgi:hypothetical protein
MKDEGIDPFAEDIIGRIDPRVLNSMTLAQIEAIRQAVTGTYLINIRGIIPLFFARYYMIFIIGRDSSAIVQMNEGFRKKRYSLMAGLTFVFLLLIPIILMVAVLYYVL